MLHRYKHFGLRRWVLLLKRTELRGPRIFDVQIAATMLSHGLKKLATYNGKDFKLTDEIQIIEPGSLN
jgi:predicted nucleic acid-binding protein